ncbi:uncharacterized protein BDR25DRAFT_361874 [Lindgomyces ingoldianus]|uniref:Uncharacterized protein n=1 Tax=Lindgomyces ingoldianus TaxID=673940 RepID=A0ACB6QB37_9PLEO|nr:uncharacterized protein BDR25DRAFT_361874 [Lindgomyces ingoldianus]KAF2464139.1 hypothetical protein BDR25DRAFT_361874 [Lindgomyces ingoldianus]
MSGKYIKRMQGEERGSMLVITSATDEMRDNLREIVRGYLTDKVRLLELEYQPVTSKSVASKAMEKSWRSISEFNVQVHVHCKLLGSRYWFGEELMVFLILNFGPLGINVVMVAKPGLTQTVRGLGIQRGPKLGPPPRYKKSVILQ